MKEKNLAYWAVWQLVKCSDGYRKEVKFYRTKKAAKKAARKKSYVKLEQHTVPPSEYPYSFMFED